MANPGLVRYIEDALSRGAELDDVRTQLLQQGYNHFEIDSSINYLLNSPREVKHTIHFSKSAVIAMVSILLAIVLTTYLVGQLTGSKPPSRLLDFETKALTSTVRPGEVLSYQVRLFNMGNAKRYDVTINSEVVGEDGKIAASKDDTFAVETRTTEAMQIEIPHSLTPGTYTLKSRAHYAQGEAVSSFQFQVYQESAEATCFDGIKNEGEIGIDCGGPCKTCAGCGDGKKNQDEKGIDCGGPCKTDCCANGFRDIELEETGVDCGGQCKACKTGCVNCDDNNPCTKDSCVGKDCGHEPIVPCCGNYICERGESFNNCATDCTAPQQEVGTIIEKAKAMSNSNLDAAVKTCRSLREDTDKDSCLESVATATNQTSVCASITSIARRDACYVNAAMAGDFSVCNKIENDYLRKNCETLKYVKGTAK
jgi:hypothetical protein